MIKIAMAADGKFKDMVRFSLEMIHKLGYQEIVYDLGGLGYGKPFTIDPTDIAIDDYSHVTNSYFKPRVVRDAFDRDSNIPIVWLDADAIIVKPIDDAMTDDYDVGVTMRRQEERGSTPTPEITGYLNAGVVFFNITDKAYEFINLWESRRVSLSPPNDQYALNELVMECTDLTDYNRVFVRDDGIRIKIFNCEDYNCFYFDGAEKDAKVLHFKGAQRELYWDYARDKGIIADEVKR